jgi:DNA-binding NtrC family response regulator
LRELEALRERREVDERPAGGTLPGEVPRFGRLVGDAPAMLDLYDGIARAARCDAPVLITGPSGSGKGLVAREVHARSERSDRPYLIYTCAAVPDPVCERELFGHEDQPGLFLQTDAGSLVLDELAELSPAMQAKLLRVLQEGHLRSPSGHAPQPISCRVLAITREDLPRRVQQGLFREDLFYRLDVLRLSVPPLAGRAGDIPALLAAFLAREGAADATLSAEALERLVAYPWPGNVRELHNEVLRLATRTRQLTSEHLSFEIREGQPEPRAYAGKTLGEVERDMLEAALAKAQGNKSQAARILNVPRSTLYELIKRHGL